jgi:hypothetical protein
MKRIPLLELAGLIAPGRLFVQRAAEDRRRRR